MAGDRSWMFRPPFDPNPEREPTDEERYDHRMDFCVPRECPLCAKERADDDAHERHREEYR